MCCCLACVRLLRRCLRSFLHLHRLLLLLLAWLRSASFLYDAKPVTDDLKGVVDALTAKLKSLGAERQA